jgi:hypothetical protein
LMKPTLMSSNGFENPKDVNHNKLKRALDRSDDPFQR